MNLSDVEIPVKVSNILSLGEKFCPPIPKGSVPYIQIIADIESALIDNTDKELDTHLLRNEITNILTNFKNRDKNKQRLNSRELSLIRDINCTRKFVKEHPEILITKADKGNITVLVERSDYVNKMNSLLSDENIYQLIEKENTASIQRKLNLLVTSWQNDGRLNATEAKFLRCHHGVLAKMYGLPKVHKPNTPYRPIVSSIGTPLYAMSAYISKILNCTVGKSGTTVKNSTEFRQKIRNIVLPPDYIILSLDVVSLFTNIDCVLVLTLLSDRWREIKRNSNTKLKKAQFIEAIELILHNCEFSFQGQVYRQIFGAPMGSPTSPAIAELVMEFVETSVLGSLDFIPAFYFRYVDDIVTAIPKDKLNIFFQTFNSFNNNIKFTLEMESNNRLAFLDICILHNTDGSLSTDWFHKSTWSGRYLNFKSHLPFSYKKNTVQLLARKILELSDTQFHRNNFKLLKTTLLNNGYPYSFFNKIIKTTIHNFSLSHDNRQTVESSQPSSQSQTKIISIPYIDSLFESISHCLKKYKFVTVGRAHNNLGVSLFTPIKDRAKKQELRNVVYKIVCECSRSYIGQTQQSLGTRFYQHKRDAQKLTLGKTKSDLTSALSNHLHESLHDIILDNVMVLGRESNHSKRRVLEMLHIKMNPGSLNKQADCTYLSNTYNHLLRD